MKIQYDKMLKVAGIGMVPWPRLGPERWFDDYKIASFQGWDMQVSGAPEVLALSDIVENPQLPRLNTPSLLKNARFQQLLKERLAGYRLLTYKPVVPPSELSEFTFLKTNQSIAGRLENKAQFRELMRPHGIPFPAYKILERAGVSAKDAASILAGREAVIVQDDTLSGGKGTHIVRDEKTLQKALDDIAHNDGGRYLVVSDYIAGARERSVQCVVTRYGIFIGPIQTQIVANPLLANLQVPDGDRFCGAQIAPDDAYTGAYPEVRRIAERIGKVIAEMGYRGIFGIDMLFDASGRCYVLEVNPRLTGVTPLLAMLYRGGRDIPFYLLHILELADAEYEIVDTFVDPEPPTGSLLVLHARTTSKTAITEQLQSGLYDYEDVSFLKKDFRLDSGEPSPQLLVQQYMPVGSTIKPGGRVATIFSNRTVLDAADTLLPIVAHQVECLYKQIAQKEVI